MTRQQFYRALFIFSTAIGLLLFAILITLLTKDSWHLTETGHIIAMVGVFALFPVYGLMCKHLGKIEANNRQRARINDFTATYYTTEPHGIKFSQKHR
jgi:hypothetical protein